MINFLDESKSLEKVLIDYNGITSCVEIALKFLN
jgi:hypothetical protein